MPPRPSTLVAELSYQCPLHCPYCSNPVDIGGERCREELETEHWTRVFREARPLGVLQLALTGGEPMLRRDLDELCAAARAAGLYSSLVTAGTLFTRERAEQLKAAGLDHVQISIQSPDPEENDRIASNRSFEKKLEAARAARELGFPLTINCVLHRQNLDRIEQLLALALELGAQRLELANTQYYGWAVPNQQALMPTREQLERGEEAVQRFRERVGPRSRCSGCSPTSSRTCRSRAWAAGAGRRWSSRRTARCSPARPPRRSPGSSSPASATIAGVDLARVRRVRALPRHGLDAGALPLLPARAPGGGLRRLPLPGAAAHGRRDGDGSRLPLLAPPRPRRRRPRARADGRVRLPHDEALDRCSRGRARAARRARCGGTRARPRGRRCP